MPNARKAGKRCVGAWVEEELFEAVLEVAEANGQTSAEVLRDALNAFLGPPPKVKEQRPGYGKKSAKRGKETTK